MAITKRTLLKSSIDHEVTRNEEWENETGTKLRRWVQLDGRTVRLIPILSGTGGDNGCTIRIDYIQAPKPLTTVDTVAAGNFVVGQWYEIADAGTTAWASIGLDTSTEEGSLNQFQATGAGSGTGTAYEIVDPRIYPEHQAYLKYAAAAFLLSMQGTPAAMAKADDMMKKFRALIGVE